MESYWSTLRTRQRLHPVPHLAVQIQPGKSGLLIFEDLRSKTRRVEDLLEHYRLSDQGILDELKRLLKKLGYDLTHWNPYHTMRTALRFEIGNSITSDQRTFYST